MIYKISLSTGAGEEVMQKCLVITRHFCITSSPAPVLRLIL